MMYEQLSLGREVLFTHVGSPKQAEDTQVHRSRRKERRELLDDTANLLPLLECHSEQEKLSVTEKSKFCASTPKREPGRSQNLQAGLRHLSSCESYRKNKKTHKQPTTTKKQQQKTPSIFNLLEVTRNNQPRFVICKSSWQHCLLSVMNCLSVAGAHWQPFMPIAVRFLTLSHSWPNRRHELNGWTQDGLGTD